LAGVVFCAPFALFVAKFSRVPKQPNILWIVTTQWRAQACGYAGDANARTPWLDGLASEAVDFTQAVTPHPLGPQARAALLTGRLCPENGVSSYWDPLPIYHGATDGGGAELGGHRTSPQLGRTVAHALGDRGYRTAWFGKWHLAPRDRSAPFVGEAHAKQIVPPERRGGFSLWEGFEGGFLLNDPWLHGTRLPEPKHFKGYQADVLVQRAADWLREPHGTPVFCVVSLEAPHPPYHAAAGSTGSRQVPHVHEPRPAAIQLRANVPLGGEVEHKAREELAGYYAHIEATDRAVGRLLAEIDLSETIVAFTSVHGDMHGSHGLFRKAWPHEESVRVPLLIRGLRTENRGRTDLAPVSLVDLPHMAVAWAEGRDWVCKRDSAPISMPSATEIPLQCPQAWRGFRTAQHKVVVRREEDGREKPWLFFDLERDPLELRNLADEPARAAEMRELMQWL
jgi:arylsulfatase A-like enzyme